jgi:ATP-binding cassette, subfamily B, bacterial HlyB/CyaB
MPADVERNSVTSAQSAAAGQQPPDSGLLALVLIAGHFHIAAQPAQLRHELGLGAALASADDLTRAGRRIGLKARAMTRQPVRRLETVPLPCIVEVGQRQYSILVARMDGGRYRLADPVTRKFSEMPSEELTAVWTGTIVQLTRRISVDRLASDFGLSWFLPSIFRYRKALLQVLVASLFIQLCGLITPLFFQITVDKVLVHRSYSTLVMIVVGLAGLGIFHVLLQYLRTYVLSHTTSRIDVELGARLFDHLLRLPLAYFETRPAGQTVARVRELETIRAFLTGQGLSSAIDLLFSIVFIGVLFIYSRTLATIVVASIPAYVVVATFLRPALREKIKERFNRGAASNQFLVEAVVGAQTVKASAIEPMLRTQWEERLAAYVRTSFEAVMLAAAGQNTIQYVNKVTTALILYFGATAVINGELTVGELVAFNMIMNQATQPILRLAQFWQDFQQVQISVDRIGDILNSPPESRSLAKAHLPPAKGAINVLNLVFRYEPAGPEILKGITIEIAAGEVVGIIGRSGSGKSTFTKLLQRLYAPERGQILVDGIDIAQVDPAWLRRQIGVVLQENLLFHRTVHDNIALANPGMPRARVMAMARLSGADEFISQLPLGYDHVIEERGSNLSGGQRQRIAIARALATDPRILIFDEATSALDYESERLIQENMQHIVRGRTVIIIAHRLAAVRDCDRIIAFDEGRVCEEGTPRELLSKPASLYSRLWRIQMGGSLEDAESVA